MSMGSRWIIAIDAGGTKCKACLYDQQGSLFASAQTGAANMFSDFDGAIASILQAAKLVCESVPEAISYEECTLSVGAAGASLAVVQEQFSQWQHPFKHAFLCSDIHASSEAANASKDCVFVVVGTGSSIAIYEKGEICQIGGHGFLLGDQASGAWLGRQAVIWYLQTLDLLIDNDEKLQEAALLDLLAEELGTAANTIVEQYAQANANKFAALVPLLLSVQQQSQQVQAWSKEGASYLCAVLQKHAKDLPIFIDGGLANLYRQPVSRLLTKTLLKPSKDATYGAYLYAKKLTKTL